MSDCSSFIHVMTLVAHRIALWTLDDDVPVGRLAPFSFQPFLNITLFNVTRWCCHIVPNKVSKNVLKSLVPIQLSKSFIVIELSENNWI